MRNRNEWFKEVERAYSNLELKTVNRPYEMPIEADVVEGEDILWALGLHPRLDTSDWLVIDLDEVSELVELVRPVPVTGATSDDAIERIGTLRDLLKAEVKAEKGGGE